MSSATVGPVLMYAALAVGVMWSYRSSRYRSVSDLDAFIAGVVEAGNALRDGQFPIRVAPHQLDGVQYPLFQFYANFPYTVSGAMFAAGLNPYAAWRVAMMAVITAGGTFTYLAAYRLTRRSPASIVAGAAYVLAPYLFTDLNARGAIAEFFALQLLPIALYATLRCVSSPRRRWRYIPACAVAWTLVGLTHNITYLYGALFVGALTLSMLGRPRRVPARVTRLAVAGVLHAGLMAWYVVPQMRVLPLLEVREQIASPTGPGALTSADILFAPVLRSPPSSSTPNLGLQVGWAILAGVVLAVVGALVARRRQRYVRRVTTRLVALFAVALVMAWSPLGVWDRVPRLLWFIQFPYRLLGYTTLFGALLTACALALCLSRGREDGRRMVYLVALALIGAGAISYFPRARLRYPNFVRETVAHPVCMGLNDYLLSGPATAATGYAHPDVDLSSPAFGLVHSTGFVIGEVREHAAAGLNIPTGATAIRLRGSAENAGDGQPPEKVEIKLGPREFVQAMPAGTFDLIFPIDPSGGPVQVLTLTPRDHVGRHVRMLLSSARYEGARPPERRLIVAEDVAAEVRKGHNVRYRFTCDDPVLLQLPVLYYPGMLRFRDNGKAIPFANVGRYVAAELPPGNHSISVRFTGVGWANVISAVAWGVVALSVVLTFARASTNRRSRARYSTGRRRRAGPPARWTIGETAVACVAVAVGGSVALAARAVRERVAAATGSPAAFSTRSAADHPAAHTVDGRPDTVWHVNGPDPARLTILLPAPRSVRGLRLHARRTKLLEAWHQVNLSCYLADWPAVQQTIGLPNAARQSATEIKFAEPVTLDRVEMEFFDPVVELPDGQRVPPELVNPGYAEIELLEGKP